MFQIFISWKLSSAFKSFTCKLC